MKFLDATTLFEGEPVSLALLSTFQFDPDFFERRVLRCGALAKARRIVVFMDAGQWFQLLRQDAPARFLNRRYLVVPVHRTSGVFHPKLHLLVRDAGGQLLCGSNNLTRSGCSSNLELLNAVSLDLENTDEEALRLVQEGYRFFKRACDDAEQGTGGIAREWLEDLPKRIPWLGVSEPTSDQRNLTLVHTYDGSLWTRLVRLFENSPLRRLLVISPFHDLDASLFKRFRQQWPRCEIEFVVQQQTTNLPVSALRGLPGRLKLSAIGNTSRRLHAKLVVWESGDTTGCLVGSANFTTAAFDGHNVEACILVRDADALVRALFDRELPKKSIDLEDFEPGTDREPETAETESAEIDLLSAVLAESGELKVRYRHRLKGVQNLHLAIRAPGEQRPRVQLKVPNRETHSASLNLSGNALNDAHGTILASLIADLGTSRKESYPVWIAQEGRLTYEPGEGSSSSKSRVEDTGEGLPEFLDELGKRDGVGAVIEFLQNLNIRFHDAGDGGSGKRKFRVRLRDPFRSDDAPTWLLETRADEKELEAAIYDFVERHEKQRLQRHARRGNSNGMENFLDIFTTLIRLLYIWYVRGVVEKARLIGFVGRFLDLAMNGDEEADIPDGYLATVYDNLDRDSAYLQKLCDELNFLGDIRAAFVLLQKVRFLPDEKSKWSPPAKRPHECLPQRREELRKAIMILGLQEPTHAQVVQALEDYRMLNEKELAQVAEDAIP
jgi:hypothetical protein